MSEMSGTYVYIAKDRGGSRSYVGVATSLLEMGWISDFGVNHLVWFDSWPIEADALAHAERLREMTESERSGVFLKHNPEEIDLYARIQCSDPYDNQP